MRYTFLLAALACGLMTPGTSDAYWWNGAGVGIGDLYRRLDFPTELRVPYFASRPPVYYSQPIPRTYGYSPFAYTPDTRTPDVAPCAKPVEIINPYVQPSSTPSTSSPKSRGPKGRTISSEVKVKPAGPLTILNPYVESDGRTI